MVTSTEIALIYDFDGTLSPKNMQEFGLIQSIGCSVDEFWKQTGELSGANDASGILCYMGHMLTLARREGIKVSREMLHRFGADVELYQGVASWFDRINSYGASLGLNLKHYIISSGLKEMIEGTSIADCFEEIYACSYLYNEDGEAYWPALAVDYTMKTQFLYKINKGIREVSDARRVNQYLPLEERPIPFSNILYFGDGETDVPCMRLVRESGGNSLAIYREEGCRSMAEHLLGDGRVNFACLADYREGSPVDEAVRSILDAIARNHNN